jgi:transposase
MEHIGIDVHKNQSSVCIRTEDGRYVERRIRTERKRFAAVLSGRPRARVVIEASTESEWVAQCVAGLGHEVIVADPNYAPMYGQRNRRVKTDRRDARALSEACQLGAYRPAHRVSAARRQVRAELVVRDALVRTRARYITVIGTLLRRDGIRVPTGAARTFVSRLDVLELPAALAATVAPLRALLAPLNQQLAEVAARLDARVANDAVMRQLQTVPGVGPVTAATFVATLDGVARFTGPHQVAAYLGLVPSERSSAERQHRGAITKRGNTRARWVVVQAAWGVWRTRHPAAVPLQRWARRIATRRGKRVAIVALARRLAGILYALWRDGTVYDPACLTRTPHARIAA